MLPSPTLKRPNLGRAVRWERDCPHKLVLQATGNYKCRRCGVTFEMSQPKAVETEEEFARALGRKYR